MNVEQVHGEPSLRVSSDQVEAWITLRGGHIAPVVFHEAGRTSSPYSLAPWLPGEIAGNDDLLDVLRGDFWCLPFGAQPDGPAHGEPASGPWTVQEQGSSHVTLAMDALDSGAHIVKTLSVRDGQLATFQEFVMSQLDGDFPFGTHPILDFSKLPAGAVQLSTSQMKWMSVFDGVFSDPEAGEVQILRPSAEFTDLSKVARADGSVADISRYPRDEAHEDLVMLCNDEAAGNLGWSAASADSEDGGVVWFALKDVRDFPSTLFWMSNGGRSQAPWNGRHRGRIGIEDVCSWFHAGLVPSRENRLAHLGIPTARTFQADETVTLRVLQAVAFTPKGFGRVAAIETPDQQTVRIVNDAGAVVEQHLEWSFVLRESR